MKRVLSLLTCLAPSLLSTVDAVAAEEDTPPAAAPASRATTAADEWQARIKEAELQGRYEETVFRNERNRKRYEAERQRGDDEPTPRGIEQRRLLLPDLASVIYGDRPGLGALGGSAGPLYFTNFRSGEVSSTTFGVSLAADVILAKRWTLGAGVDGSRSYSNAPGQEADSFDLGGKARVGMLVPLGHGLSLWPRLGVGVARGRYEVLTHANPSAPTREITYRTTLSPTASIALVVPIGRAVFFRVEQTVSYTSSGVDDADDATDVVSVGGRAALGLSL